MFPIDRTDLIEERKLALPPLAQDFTERYARHRAQTLSQYSAVRDKIAEIRERDSEVVATLAHYERQRQHGVSFSEADDKVVERLEARHKEFQADMRRRQA